MIKKCESCQNGCPCKCKIGGGIFGLILLIGIIIFAWRFFDKANEVQVKVEKAMTNFTECEVAGYPVMESYPRQCQGKNMVYVEDVAVTNNEEEKHKDLIVLDNIHAGSYIESPVTITGKARGNWFFESSFPISIVNWDGLIIGQGVAQAKGEWMTEEFVLFEAKISFDKATYKNNGAIILQKDNPSGLKEFDDALEIPIFFK